MTRRVLSVLALYAGALLIGLVLVSVPASSVFLMQKHGLTEQQYGQVFLPQLVLAIAGALLAGAAVRRLSLRSMYLFALLCFFLSQAFLWYSSHADSTIAFLAIMCATAFFGFGFGFGGGPLNGLVSLRFAARSDTAITALHLMAGVGLMVGPIYFRLLESHGEWAWAPAALAVSSIFLAMLTAHSVDPYRPETMARKGKSPAASAYFWLVMLIAFCYALVEGAFSNWAVIFVTVEKMQSADVGAQALAAFWGGLTLGRLLATFSVQHIGAYRMWIVLPALMVIAFLLLPQFDGAAVLVLGYGFAGIACSAFFPLMVAVAAKPFPEDLSWIASMLTASLMLGVGVGSYVIGSFAGSVTISHLYLYSSALPAIALALMLIAGRIAASYDRVRAV